MVLSEYVYPHMCLAKMSGVDPMKRFGKKRDKCVLYSQCFRVGLDVNSTLPLLGFNVYEYAPRGVMTGIGCMIFFGC